VKNDVLRETRLRDIPDENFNSIIGHEDAKAALIQSVILPVTQPQIFEGLSSWKRILLYGPPGTGKTTLAKCTAAEAKVPFYAVSCSSLLSPYLGESERKIRELFQDARTHSTNHKPAIIFIDEIDSITRTRTSHEDETTRRIKSELLQQLEGFGTKTEPEPFVIACSNCPWDLDPAFVRRFSRRIFIDLPTPGDALAILKSKLAQARLSDEFDQDSWKSIAEMANGYSGSDLSNVATAALLCPIQEVITCKEWQIDQDGKMQPMTNDESLLFGCEPISCTWRELPEGIVRTREVKLADIFAAFRQIKPTVPVDLRQKYIAYDDS